MSLSGCKVYVERVKQYAMLSNMMLGNRFIECSFCRCNTMKGEVGVTFSIVILKIAILSTLLVYC